MFTADQVSEHFGGQIHQAAAGRAARLMNGQVQIDPYNVQEEYPQTAKWCNQCHNPPSDQELILSALNETIGGFGIESIDDSGEHLADYVNTGDTYSATIVLDSETGEFLLTTWGDFHESWTAEQNEQDGTIDCGYCSHRTPLSDSADWRETVCEQCGHHVDGSN